MGTPGTAGRLITGAWPPSLIEQAVAATMATSDVALRTAAASMVAATLAPTVISHRSMMHDLEQAEFYASLAAAGDAAAAFVAPPAGVPVRARQLSPPPWLRAIGRIDSLTFESPFEARNPLERDRYAAHRRNRVARAQHWRHLDAPRPTIIVLHGFMASPPMFNAAFFSLPWFYGHGYDVMLVTLPFHGRRGARTAPYNGYGLFAHGISHLNEAVLQAVSDVRVLIGYALDAGAPRVGVTGLSLGGYVTAALAAAEDRLHFAIPNAAVTEMSSVARAWFPAGALIEQGLARVGVGFERFRRVMAVHSPLNYPPAIAEDRLFIIGGLGDRLAPPEQSVQLWEHWQRCRLHWYPGSHILHINRGDYLRQMGRFLQATGFAYEPAA